MQLFYHFPESALTDYDIIYLPGPNNSLSPYKKYKESTNLLPGKSIKPSALKALKDLNLVEKDLDTIINEFIELYSTIFTDPDEKEDTEGMIRRVKGLEKVTGQTILVICVRKKDKEVVGGFILELHYRSVCLLLTYIFTKQSERGKGLGYSFIQTVLPYVVSNLIDVSLKAVFLETENPAFTPDHSDILKRGNVDSNSENNHLKRLAFFRKAGAKWLNISYTQPKLSTEPEDFGNRVYHLFFLMLPDAVRNKNLTADKGTIFNFLFNFYNILEHSDREKLVKNNFSINLQHEEKSLVVEDIDLYRSYLQIELLDTLYQFSSIANHDQQIINIIELIDSLRNQFRFVAIQVKKIKEYTYYLTQRGFNAVFIKELTQLLIEKITGVNENPKSTNPILNDEYEKYLVDNLKHTSYSNLYINQGNKGDIDVNKAESLPQSPIDQEFYPLNYIRQALISIKKRYLPIDTCSNYNAFISDIPDS
ncbi:hypothetical protein GCM10028808_17160 [Spirosoma migulaei]